MPSDTPRRETPLRQLIDEAGRLPLERALDIAVKAARAIDRLHDRGHALAAIRPETILVGDDGSVRIEERQSSADPESPTTYELEAISADVAAYMSPEEVQGSDMDRRSDLYSLGVVLFESLTGTVPFRGSTPTALAYKHARERPPRLDDVDPEMPPHLADAVGKALAKDPDRRYQSGLEMVDALVGSFGEAALVASLPSSISEPEAERASAAPSISPGWPRVAMAALVVLLLAAASTGVLPLPSGSDVRTDDVSTAGLASEDEDEAGDPLGRPEQGSWQDLEARSEPGHTESDSDLPTGPTPTDPDDGSPTPTSPVAPGETTTTTMAPTTTSTAVPSTVTTTTTPSTTTTIPAVTTTTVPSITTTTITTTTTTVPLP